MSGFVRLLQERKRVNIVTFYVKDRVIVWNTPLDKGNIQGWLCFILSEKIWNIKFLSESNYNG